MTQINTAEIHSAHIFKCHKKLKILEKDVFTYSIARGKLIEHLNSYKEIIDLCCSSTFEELQHMDSFLPFMYIKFDISKVNIKSKGINTSAILSLINIIIRTNKLIKNIDKEIKFLRNNCISYYVYKDILDIFNLSIIDKILEGYSFNLGYSLSEIRILKKKRNKANIDWGESNKLKALLISQGKTPYSKTDAPNGEHWRVFHTSEYHYWWYWKKTRESHLIHNIYQYSFKPSAGINGAKAKLNNLLKNNKFSTLNFSE